MSRLPTGVDTLTVPALDREDAKDVARRQWETFGFRVVEFLGDPEPMNASASKWRVTARVEVVRP